MLTFGRLSTLNAMSAFLYIWGLRVMHIILIGKVFNMPSMLKGGRRSSLVGSDHSQPSVPTFSDLTFGASFARRSGAPEIAGVAGAPADFRCPSGAVPKFVA